MIKKIYLHIGLHKTGTTSIQNALSQNRASLYKMGYLYPEFRMGKKCIANHSIPVYSMFCSEPEKYHINIMFGYTDPASINNLHKEYYNQLTSQINNFPGENLIISGEDISRLQDKELGKLKEFLVSITCPKVVIVVLLVIRDPVDWYRSLVQQWVKMSRISLEIRNSFIHSAELSLNVLTTVRQVYGGENVRCSKYEDMIKQKSGIFAVFLNALNVKVDENEGLILKSEFLNTSISYESFMILNSIFRIYPKIINNQINPIYTDFLLNSLYQIPGVKFRLSEENCLLAWESLSVLINSFLKKYELPPYEYMEIPKTDDTVKWGDAAIDYLIGIMPSIPKDQAVVIIDCLLSELKTYHRSFSWSKKLSLFAPVMLYSAYLDTRSKLHKVVHLAQRIGIVQFLILAVLYKTNQRKLTQHMISLRKNTN